MLFWKTTGLFFKVCIIAFIAFVISVSIIVALYLNGLKNKSTAYDSIILAAAVRYNIDPDLIKAVIWKESSFNSSIIGAKKECGLMQIMEKSAVQDWVNYRKCDVPPTGILYLPEVNIDIGAWYLSRCLSHWNKYQNSMALTLAEYNAGYRNAKEWVPLTLDGEVIERIKFPSTKSYVKSILKKYESYKSSDTKLQE